MASLKDIRTRISSIASNQKITRAMKLVSTAKFKPTQQAYLGFTAYVEAHEEMLQVLLQHVAFVEQTKGIRIEHPLLAKPGDQSDKPRAIFAICSDRGMCGSFNSNLVRSLLSYIKKPGEAADGTALKPLKAKLYPLGVHMSKACAREKLNVVEDFGAMRDAYDPHQEESQLPKIREVLTKAYTNGECDAVDIFSNNFKSAISQQPKATRLLPIERVKLTETTEFSNTDILCEPDLQALLNEFLPKIVEMRLKRAVLSSLVGEHAARMNAMSSATDNAQTMIEDLTLQLNHARQAAITTELVEIISGAEALK